VDQFCWPEVDQICWPLTMVDIKELTPHPLTREKELTAKNPRRYF
jgi:hypothetical protein